MKEQKTDISIHDQVIEHLLHESQAISKTAQVLDAIEIEKSIEILSTCQGKVMLIGVGKSGLVARKIAATITSTGTTAIYLHATDAAHGDLGVVAKKDVVIALSNSGETDEIIELLPHLKKRGVPIIAIVGNLKSTLARNADAVLDATVDREIDPNNLAPTTSTTVALAIGDALAITLMQVKGLTAEDFAVNHPAGRLGKRLTLTVSDLMHSGAKNPTIYESATWIEVVTAISQTGLGGLNVVDDRARLLGIITDGDLRRLFQKVKTTELEFLTASEIMTKEPVVIQPEVLAYDALQLMENRKSQISVLSVVDKDHICLGLIRLHDIVRTGL